MSAEAIWHDVECGGYLADLGLWDELAAEAAGPVLDLGCGTGRVALHLARGGHAVTGLDAAPALVAELNRRATAEELPAEAFAGDARDFVLGRRFASVLAPMQLLQLFGGREERVACLASVAAHLEPGGLAATAIVEAVEEGGGRGFEPIPDVREVDDWVYSSLPVATVLADGRIVLRRLRKAVSPDGELAEETDEVRLAVLSVGVLEDEGREAGLRPAGRRTVAATADHVGSAVVLFARET
jgi:SAM-dependent methyltransferase